MDIVFDTEKAVFNYRAAAIWMENDHVLVHRSVNEEDWSLPGGRVKIAEESKTSIKREMREELDVDVKVERTLWIAENFFDYNDKCFHEIGFYFLVSPVDGSNYFRENDFIGLEGERLIYKWVPLNELKNIKLNPNFLIDGLKCIPNETQHLIVK